MLARRTLAGKAGCQRSLLTDATHTLPWYPDSTTHSTTRQVQHPPFVWHQDYSIPWPPNHRFPMWKFGDLAKHALAQGLVAHHQDFISPDGPAGDDICSLAHAPSYLQELQDNTVDLRRSGFGSRPSHAALMRRTRLEVAGTLLTARLALGAGMACHLAGGTHHAHSNWGSGYTLINDLAVTCAILLAEDPEMRIAVIDLDVHQGDGTAQILSSHDRAFTCSVHCGDNFPFGFHNLKGVEHLGLDCSDLDVSVPAGTGDTAYLQLLGHTVLPAVLDGHPMPSDQASRSAKPFAQPDLVIYDAGVDVATVDKLGKLKLSNAGMLKRDELVLRECSKRGIAVASVIGGGYDSNRDKLARRHAIILQAACNVWKQRLEGDFRASFLKSAIFQ